MFYIVGAFRSEIKSFVSEYVTDDEKKAHEVKDDILKENDVKDSFIVEFNTMDGVKKYLFNQQCEDIANLLSPLPKSLLIR